MDDGIHATEAENRSCDTWHMKCLSVWRTRRFRWWAGLDCAGHVSLSGARAASDVGLLRGLGWAERGGGEMG